jgi:hypothetical protein
MHIQPYAVEMQGIVLPCEMHWNFTSVQVKLLELLCQLFKLVRILVAVQHQTQLSYNYRLQELLSRT